MDKNETILRKKRVQILVKIKTANTVKVSFKISFFKLMKSNMYNFSNFIFSTIIFSFFNFQVLIFSSLHNFHSN